MRSVRDAIVLILKTPNAIGPMLALVLNLILPSTSTDTDETDVKQAVAKPSTESA